MNCANHPTIPAIAYCRTCGKPLCASCKRDVMGVIYCEQCLADRLKDVQPNVPLPAPGFVPVAPIGNMGISAPHPAVAGILAGFFPFGVGAVYTGQYAKGLAHLVIFVGLIWGVSSGHATGLIVALAIALGFFYVYQIIDSVRSAHAIRMGQTPPDPFGFNRTFGMVDRATTGNTTVSSVAPASVPDAPAPKVPTAAVVLIGLGALFLLQTAGVFEFNVERIWPLFLIGLGVWLFVSRTGMLGHRYDSRAACSKRVWSGPVWLITIGGLFLLQTFDDRLGFGHTWPVILLVIGLMKVFENRTAQLPPAEVPPTAGFQPPPVAPPQSEVSSTEVKNG